MSTYASTLGAVTTLAMIAELDGSKLASVIPGEDETALVASSGGKVVATLVYAERHGVAYVWGMYVLPEYQHQGIGSALMKDAISRLGDSESIEVRVMTTSLQALSFYEKFGFTAVGEEDFELPRGTSAPVMVMARAKNLTR